MKFKASERVSRAQSLSHFFAFTDDLLSVPKPRGSPSGSPCCISITVRVVRHRSFPAVRSSIRSRSCCIHRTQRGKCGVRVERKPGSVIGKVTVNIRDDDGTSPTADATRLTEFARTSPTARCRACWSVRALIEAVCASVRIKPSCRVGPCEQPARVGLSADHHEDGGEVLHRTLARAQVDPTHSLKDRSPASATISDSV